jgi:hypothetical protein
MYCAAQQPDMTLLDADLDTCFFATYLSQKCKLQHYIGEFNEGPIVISAESAKGKKFQRAIIRTKKVRTLCRVVCNPVADL